MTATICSTPADTRSHAFQFAQTLAPGTLLLLRGDLGAGKTEWVKGLVLGLGSSDEVTSPTFTLMHEYRGGKYLIYHWDLYRLGEKTDWSALDFFQGNSHAITVVEWPEHFAEWSGHAVTIHFAIMQNEQRSITVKEMS
ncbi:MAG: tRNA (adenosine(37)-N6)-threonylcarbamoyltransferase complex ATPase subunit type 1 TsaE [Verrucomicrobiota bacterium]